ncbi:Short-chain dehydrogenase [Penicillium psychrosexuale]|uniref:Short-chain dehydrogenase n=1 Tax=Penicillium psychrosexuale TaxID=1002107 RepID=UPI0025453DF2|nr:Short-chain dehydrogenase [Penicillium psychrosexuale]KAJ5783332.1 Short-chain dehydrogenase [Penicillium psychrosexuale]
MTTSEVAYTDSQKSTADIHGVETEFPEVITNAKPPLQLPSQTWASNTETLKGTIIITGANGSLGSALVRHVFSSPNLADDYYGVYTVRRLETATNLEKTLTHAPVTHKHESIALDLSRLSEVRAVADSINKRVSEGSLPRIRALILNAGYQEFTTQNFSEDGFDMSFQCNYLSHWLLTLMLLGSMDKEHGRIVVIGSNTHDPYDPRNKSIGMFEGEQWKILFHDAESLAKGTWSTPKDDPTLKAGLRRYSAAKLCQVMMIYELQRRLNTDPSLFNISILGVDPGGMPSNLTRRGSFSMIILMKTVIPLLAFILVRLSPNGPLRTTTKSAKDVVGAAFDTQTIGEQPKNVYLNGSEFSQPGAEARDVEKQSLLWHDSAKFTKLNKDETALLN